MSIVSKLDDVDLEILQVLQNDSRVPMQSLAERFKISVPACYRRIRKLRETGAIDREVALVRPQAMGWPLMMIVLVTLERERSEIIDQIIDRFIQVPEIIEAWYVTGDHDFALRIIARDMESFEDLTRRLLFSDNSIRNFRTLVVVRSVKPLSPVPGAY